MKDSNTDPEANDDDGQSQMPVPPDIASLIEKQQKNLQAMYKASATMYKAYPARDQAFSTLGATLGAEITSVHVIADAVHSPDQALASIPLVLAAANTAFATIPLTEAAITATTEAATAKFSSDMKSAEEG